MPNAYVESGSGGAEFEQSVSRMTVSYPRPTRSASPTQASLAEAQRKTHSFGYTVLKRAFDLLASFLMIVLASPIFLITALVVWFSSPGPIFYREKRIGRYGIPFTIFKFRSMHTKEYLSHVLGYQENEDMRLHRRQHGKINGDPRLTKAGRFLRQSSLDELPQLFNVVFGNMTLVGPRPVIAAELDSYGDDAAFYKLVTPGVTGLWQVSGRSRLTFEQRITLDVRYCAHWSFGRDLIILARTIPAVAFGFGAR